MKTCSICGITKLKSMFFFQNKAELKLHAQCKECYKRKREVHYDKHYEQYGDSYRARAKSRSAIVRANLHLKMLEYLSDKSCEICQQTDIRTLEFDHINPDEKSFNISQGFRAGMSWGKIYQEILKCRILCANCHKIHTAKQFGWYKNI